MEQNQTADFDPIYQTVDAARLLGYAHRQSIWRLVQEGKLPKPLYLSPRCAGWRKSTLEQFIADRVKASA